MMGRLSHYYKKFRIELRRRGLVGAMGETFGFLFRRGLGIQFLVEAFEYHVLAKRRSIAATLIRRTQFVPLVSDKVLIYVSYDSESKIRDHVTEQFQFFKSQGYQIVFVTTSPQINPDLLQFLKAYVDVVLHRQNVGYDFASYRLGFEEIRARISALTSLVVMNDSCLGPKFDFAPLLKQMETDTPAVYGMTKSIEIAEHIQSYFFHFGARVNAVGATTQFFDRIRILHSKWAIVRYLEIGSSVFLQRQGISIKALVDPMEAQVAALLEQHQLTEPTREPLASLWVRDLKLPFLKRSTVHEIHSGFESEL